MNTRTTQTQTREMSSIFNAGGSNKCLTLQGKEK